MWADLEIKKLLNGDAKEDKKALEEQLKEEDNAILDDLIKVAKDIHIGSEKLDAEIFDRLLAIDDESPELNIAPKYAKVRAILARIGIDDISIRIQ